MAKARSALTESVQNQVRVERRKLSLSPDVSVELLLSGRSMVGLGAVKVCGVPLRGDAVPLRADFSTPDAVHYQDFELERISQRGGAVTVETTAIGRPEVFGEMMDEYSYNLAFPAQRSARRDELDWILAPRRLELDGRSFVGLSIALRFKSRTSRIHKLTVAGPWEIGGRATGNTLYHQAYTCPPVYTATKANRFSTTCLKRLDLWGNWLGHSYQMLPRWGAIQPVRLPGGARGGAPGVLERPALREEPDSEEPRRGRGLRRRQIRLSPRRHRRDPRQVGGVQPQPRSAPGTSQARSGGPVDSRLGPRGRHHPRVLRDQALRTAAGRHARLYGPQQRAARGTGWRTRSSRSCTPRASGGSPLSPCTRAISPNWPSRTTPRPAGTAI
jgi:hypothetical protein